MGVPGTPYLTDRDRRRGRTPRRGPGGASTLGRRADCPVASTRYRRLEPSELDFCPLKRFVVSRHDRQNRTTLMVTWLLTTAPMSPDQGGPHARYTILRAAGARTVRPRLLPAHLPTLPRPGRRGDLDHRQAHRLQPPPHRPRPGPGRSLQLSPRLLETTLVRAAASPPPGEVHPRPLRPRRAHLPGGRRHRRRASRRQGLRQGLPSRPGALDP